MIDLGFFISFFRNANIWAIVLAVVFGAIWLACFWPPIFKLIEKPSWPPAIKRLVSVLIALAILIGSAFITLFFISIQRPLQNIIGNAMLQTWGGDTLTNWLLLSIIPGALLSGLIQEGAKMIPVVIYWWRKNMKIDYKLGLTLGAVAGAGFGILETQWIHNMLFATGWSWDLTQSRGLEALTPFIERFFIVAFSTASSALAGYGLAKSKGWQFYLIVSILHTILTYNIILAQAKIFSFVQVEIFIAVWAILITGAALGLRWRRQAD